MERKGLKILYFIQLPPPVHGVSTINSIVYHSRLINDGMDKILLEVKFSEGLSQLRRLNPGKIVRFFQLAGNLQKTLRKEQPDYVYFSLMPVGKGFWRDIFYVAIVKKSNARILYHLHNHGMSSHSGNALWRVLYRFVFSDSLILHLSEGLLKREINPFNFPGIKSFAVPNGIPDIASRSSPGNGTGMTILFLSNFFPAKGIYDALEIISGINRERENIRLRLVGGFMRNRHKMKLRRMIDKMGLNDDVSVAGPKYGSEKEQEYLNADIFIFPSHFRQECFPLVLLEAMCCSLPIVSSNIGAIPELLENGKEGILLDQRDIHGFIREVIELAENPAKRKKLGLAARKKFEEAYSLQHFEKNIREVMENNLISRSCR